LLGPGRPRREARADVDADAESPIPLTEYKIVLAGVIGVSVFADGAGRVMYVEVPGQNATAVREEYQKAIDSAKSAASAPPGGSARSATSFGTATAPVAARGRVDQDVVVESVGDVRLAGTLTFPSSGLDQGARHPAIVLISGSGPQDRDGNTPPSYQTFMFRRIAERLASCGIAVLRYDDRGVGGSTGDFKSAGLYDLVTDARAMVAFLGRHPNVDPARIGVVGHSEGAYIASMLAGEDPRIAACVIMAGASTTVDKVMIEQIEYQATCDELDEASRSLAAGSMPAVKKFVQDARDGKSSSAVPGNLKWLREHVQIDPVGLVRAIKAPILIVQGEKDLKVKPYHAQVLAEAAKCAGNRSVSLVVLPNTTHEFLEWPYRNPNFDPMDLMRIVEGLLATVQGWLASTL
jgi:pimeloyl-ACP methyl ester carboxylesterase